MMFLPRVALVVLLLSAGVGATAGETVFPIGPGGSIAHDVVAAPFGYAMVWSESPAGSFFRRFGPDGVPLQEPTRFAGVASQLSITASAEGWLVVARGLQLFSQRLDVFGNPVGPPTVVSDGLVIGLADFAIASNGDRRLLAWPEAVLLGDVVYATSFARDGTPLGGRSTVMPVPLQRGAPLDLSLVATPGGFVASWDEGRVVRARPLKRSGAAAGPIEQAALRSNPAPVGSEMLRLGRAQVVVYLVGESPAEMRVRERSRRGEYGDPVAIAGPAFQEELISFFLDAASAPDLVGLAYFVRNAAGTIETRFVEFGPDLVRAGAPRNIDAELGISIQASVRWDSFREQWLLFGPGTGPAGRAVYLATLARAD